MTETLLTLTVDGKTLQVPEGTALVQALLDHALTVPHDCYHPHLSVSGSCRLCLVEIEGEEALQTSCQRIVEEGMVVYTESERVRQEVQGVLELTLLNHPLDCPICEQSGECSLQDAVASTGLGNSRSTIPRHVNSRGQEIGPNLRLNADRCTLCTRCVRFSREISQTHELAILHRGVNAEITAVTPVDHPYAGNLVDLCPVGALTTKEFRFQGPAWQLKHTASVCPGCARGCNVQLESWRDRLVRIRPRSNPAVNQSWMCDHGRTLHHLRSNTTSSQRLTAPMLRKEGALKPVDWLEAVDTLLAWLKEAGEMTVGQMSALMSVEDAAMLAALLTQLNAPKAALPPTSKEVWKEDWLRCEDRTPNRAGVLPFCDELDLTGLLPRAQLLLQFCEWDSWPDARATNLKRMVYFGTHDNEALAHADLVLPIAHWTEREGSVVNTDGHLQHFEAAVHAPFNIPPLWKILSEFVYSLEGPLFADRAFVLNSALKQYPQLSSRHDKTEEEQR
jgi:NADH-quinone oxidoreductase subunit G